ncbi:MAG TPA: hypothetical protein VFE58_14020 [Tepidisphaeraceae bacterium]|jgi:hypothetical protein|nr:hypothetical protein [Tepidisphaeraceae bacterium]
MTYRGKVHNGQIVLDNPSPLAEGTPIEIIVPDCAPSPDPLSIWDDLLELAGSAGPELPSDLAENHDHYIYGTSKRPHS